MIHYTAQVETARRDTLTPDDIDDAMTALASYSPAIYTTTRGNVAARVTFPADSLTQAATTAVSVVGTALEAAVTRIDVMSEAEADLRDGEVEVPELIGVPEAAAILKVSPQRVRQMITEGKLAAHRIGDRSYALTRSEVEAKAAA